MNNILHQIASMKVHGIEMIQYCEGHEGSDEKPGKECDNSFKINLTVILND